MKLKNMSHLPATLKIKANILSASLKTAGVTKSYLVYKPMPSTDKNINPWRIIAYSKQQSTMPLSVASDILLGQILSDTTKYHNLPMVDSYICEPVDTSNIICGIK